MKYAMLVLALVLAVTNIAKSPLGHTIREHWRQASERGADAYRQE